MRNFRRTVAVITIAALMTACGNDKTAKSPDAAVPISESKQPAVEASRTESERTGKSAETPAEQTESPEPACADTDTESEKNTDQNVYDYEVKTRADGSKYAVITGFCGDYMTSFNSRWAIVFPEQLGGAVVTEFAPGAFQNIPLGDFSQRLQISPNIVSIGAHCFENCGLASITFEPVTEGAAPLAIHERAFADNTELWGIYFSDREVLLDDTVFDGCAETGYLCYRSDKDAPAKMADCLQSYAASKQWHTASIPAYYSSVPIVDYPKTPIVLKPEVRDFFYGENVPDNDRFCSFIYSENALDYGFPEWHIPCGEFCAMAMWAYEIEASSTLPSADGRYTAENLNYSSGREHAWAEGVPGNGIGERIRITVNCGYNDEQTPGTVIFLDGDIEPDLYDGYMRYTQICIVNGYAKNQQTWEANGRVKRLLMCVEDRPFAYLELEDTIKPQYFTLPFDAIKVAGGLEIHFAFTIEEVYAGTKYEDTCLTGLVIDFMGRRGH